MTSGRLRPRYSLVPPLRQAVDREAGEDRGAGAGNGRGRNLNSVGKAVADYPQVVLVVHPKAPMWTAHIKIPKPCRHDLLELVAVEADEVIRTFSF